MLRVSLKQVTPFPELLLSKCAIEPTRRAEELSVAEFGALAMALEGSGDHGGQTRQV
jgi:16S rRNA (adenine1518-N6/adenine1519-N6)-dimethyltransferase